MESVDQGSTIDSPIRAVGWEQLFRSPATANYPQVLLVVRDWAILAEQKRCIVCINGCSTGERVVLVRGVRRDFWW